MRDQLRARNGDRMRLHKCTAPTPPGPKRQEADMRIDGSVAPFHTGRSDRVGLLKNWFWPPSHPSVPLPRAQGGGAFARLICRAAAARTWHHATPSLCHARHGTKKPPPTLPSASSRRRRGSRPQGTASPHPCGLWGVD